MSLARMSLGMISMERYPIIFKYKNWGVIRLQSDVIPNDCANCKPFSAFDKGQKGG